MEKEYRLSTDAVLEALETDAHGLTSQQAAQRLEKYGPNKLKEAQNSLLQLGDYKDSKEKLAFVEKCILELASGNDAE